MSEQIKKAPALKKNKPKHNSTPWIFVRVPEGAVIKAYVDGELKIIAGLHNADGIDAAANGKFIVHAANDYTKDKELIEEMTSTLEACLECGGLDWAAEHDAEIVVQRAKGDKR